MITENTTPRWKDDKQEYLKAYYQQNKEKMIKRQREYDHRVKYCEVCDIHLKQLYHHKKSKKHINNLKSK